MNKLTVSLLAVLMTAACSDNDIKSQNKVALLLVAQQSSGTEHTIIQNLSAGLNRLKPDKAIVAITRL